MSGPAAERRLASIVALDVAGARTERDEPGSVAEIAVLRAAIEAIAAAHAGRIFNTAGDGFMLEFASSLGAVEAAIELAERCVPRVRVGVHLCDVAVQPNGDLLGHGINVTARLMAQAAPGSALISGSVRQTLHGPILQRLMARGSVKLDKMAETIEAFVVMSATPAAAATKAQRAEPLLAVLPFDNLSADAELQFFSDGVSEEILQRLARGSKLRVIGRTSSFQFRGADKSVHKVAGELKATHILDGSIRRAAARVRVAAQLVDAATQTTLWSERYDRTLEDIFAVQDEIAERIAAALNQTLSGASTPIDPEVYDLYLHASQPAFGADELLALTRQLEIVTQRAPNYADAWGKLAYARARWRYYRPFAERGAIAAAVEAEAAEALVLDARNPAARIALFMLLPPFGKFVEAEAILSRLKQDTDSEVTWMSYHLSSVGRMREAAACAQRSYTVDPLDSSAAISDGLMLWLCGRNGEAKRSFEATLARWPNMTQPAMNLILLNAHAGDWAAADALLAPERLKQFPLREFERDARGYATILRDPAARRRPLDAAQRRFAKTGYADIMALSFAAQMGFAAEAHDIAGKAKFGPAGDGHDQMGFDAYRTTFLFHAMFGAFRRDPRFVALCARLGLVDYWLKTQAWPDCADEVAAAYDFKAECERIASGPPLPPAA